MNFLGPNWKTLVSGIGTAVFATLSLLAALPYELGDLATVIPPAWKSKVLTAGLIGTFGLRVWNAVVQKDKNVTGGAVQQTLQGNYAQPGTQTLVDITQEASKLSGESVSVQKPTDPLKL